MEISKPTEYRSVVKKRISLLSWSWRTIFIGICIMLMEMDIGQNSCQALHLQGTWETENFFLFLSKFGFQKTELIDKNGTQGFIFGNITDPFFVADRVVHTSTKLQQQQQQIQPTQNQRVKRSSDKKDLSFTDVSSRSENSSTSTLSTTQLSSNSTNNTSDSDKKTLDSQNSTSSNLTQASNTSTATVLISNNSSSTKNDNTSSKNDALIKNNSSSSIVSSSVSSSTTSTTPKSTTTAVSTSTTTTTKKPTTTTTPSPYAGETTYSGTLVVLDRSYFVDFYRNRNEPDRDKACKQMFEAVSQVAYDAHCFPEGKEMFLRRVPCLKNDLCLEDLQLFKNDVVKSHQFTYNISDKTQAKFWYVSLVACYRDPKTCEWRHSSNFTNVQYDIWLVNGNPYSKAQNPLEYQFSFDRQDTVEIYLVFFVCYLVLVPLQVHAVLRQRHILPRLFTTSVALELGAVLSNVIHNLTFCLDGVGKPSLSVFGDILDILARAVFMLILLVLAKGWAITRSELTSKPFIFSIWVLYGVIHILLYVWNQTEVDVIEDIDEYQTWPGWMILMYGLRTIIMSWFVYELKDTMNHEHQPHKLNFFLHFGAAALVWFIYLPIVALIALQVSPLWRSKLLLGITYSADFLGFSVMTHLLWPTRSQQYFLLKTSLDTSLTDELEEFNEAPHVVNPYARTRRTNHWYPVNYSIQDVSSSNSLVNLGNGNHNHYPDDKEPLIIT